MDLHGPGVGSLHRLHAGPGVAQHVERFAAGRKKDIDAWKPLRCPVGDQRFVPPKVEIGRNEIDRLGDDEIDDRVGKQHRQGKEPAVRGHELHGAQGDAGEAEDREGDQQAHAAMRVAEFLGFTRGCRQRGCTCARAELEQSVIAEQTIHFHQPYQNREATVAAAASGHPDFV